MIREKRTKINLVMRLLKVVVVDFKALVDLIARLFQIFLKIFLATLVEVPQEEQATEETI